MASSVVGGLMFIGRSVSAGSGLDAAFFYLLLSRTLKIPSIRSIVSADCLDQNRPFFSFFFRTFIDSEPVFIHSLFTTSSIQSFQLFFEVFEVIHRGTSAEQ